VLDLLELADTLVEGPGNGHRLDEAGTDEIEVSERTGVVEGVVVSRRRALVVPWAERKPDN
jgi:hypothetical protein